MNRNTYGIACLRPAFDGQQTQQLMRNANGSLWSYATESEAAEMVRVLDQINPYGTMSYKVVPLVNW